MKTQPISAACFILLLILATMQPMAMASPEHAQDETLTIYYTPALGSLARQWVQHYTGQHAGQPVQLISLADQSVSPEGQTGNSLVITGQLKSGNDATSQRFTAVVGREVVVPVVSARNVYLNSITETGITPGALQSGLREKSNATWGTLLQQPVSTSIRYYGILDGTVDEVLSDFAGMTDAPALLTFCQTPEALFEKLSHDPFAIGFCRLTDLIDPATGGFMESVKLLPIDKNGNGKMDYMEQIYTSPQEFSRGVWIGKYPRKLVRNLCVEAEGPAMEGTGKDFLKWVLTSGQQDLAQAGYSGLMASEIQTQLHRLNPLPVPPLVTDKPFPIGKILFLAFLVILAAGWIVQVLVRRNRVAGVSGSTGGLQADRYFDESCVTIPGGLYFDRTHTWAFMEQEGTVRVGIDEFLSHVVGRITRLEMKGEGERVQKGEPMGTLIQDGKRLNIFAPVSGRICARNEHVIHHLKEITRQPYDAGWLLRIEPDNWSREMGLLLVAEKYRARLSGEFTRLKDFLASLIPDRSYHPSMAVLQEGGQLRDHILEECGPDVWEEFQTRFLVHN